MSVAPARSSSSRSVVRIGGASGFWGDSSVGPRQLVDSGGIDYLVFDYLAETTMAVLAAARLRKPEMGYATDFVDIAMRDVLADCIARRIKVISNAGGIHPEACAAALRALADELGIAVRIAVVLGDDVRAQIPERLLSANAYLGASGIERALAAGADVVVTGRCVDSAVTLGPLLHEFGWADDDWDRLAGGSLAGHIIECGCQATGGLHTDWQDIPDWAHIGYPIVECAADGSFTVTKPAGTGGRVLRAAVAEQLLYEIGDPAAYLLPDVVCDFRDVAIAQQDAERVSVRGARGRPPTDRYKVSATAQEGWRCTGSLVVVGRDAAAKARRTAEAILERTRELFAARGWPDYSATHIELFGIESLHGERARGGAAREVMLRLVVDHASRPALELFAREVAPAGTSWAPGTTGPGVGRPSVSPLVRPTALFVPKASVPAAMVLDGGAPQPVPAARTFAQVAVAPVPPPAAIDPREATHEVPLVALAWARSGDKGDDSNIGLVARRPEWLPWIWHGAAPDVVKRWFAHLGTGEVERFHLPGIHGLNLLLHGALAGGGARSPRIDPLGKGMGQMLLELPIRVPADIANAAGGGH